MRSYQIIPKKYRPASFSTIVGQDVIVTTLKNALRFNRLANAYLFCGVRGTGKTTIARLFAKAINCHHLTDEGEPCNQCPSCLAINSGNSLDILEIDGASNRGIDDVRQINETVGYAPAFGKYKIYLIDEVHMLTKEAFNALLKTLEEPPSHVKFFFATTEPHKVLPTIISRCQRFDLQRIAPDVMRAKLAWIAKDLSAEIEEGALNLLIKASEGSLRDAESLLDQLLCSVSGPATEEMAAALLGLMPHSSFFALDAAIFQENLPYAFSLAEQLFSSGKDPVHFLEGLIDHYRCHLLTHIAPAALEPHQKKEYAASPYTRDHCLYILDFLLKTLEALSKSPFKQTALEMVLLHLLRSKSRLTIDTLVSRLESLEKSGPSISPQPVLAEKKVEAPVPPAPEPVAAAAIEPPKEELIPSDPLPFQKALREPQEASASPLQNKPQERKMAQHKLDTLVRFAAIELEGTIKG